MNIETARSVHRNCIVRHRNKKQHNATSRYFLLHNAGSRQRFPGPQPRRFARAGRLQFDCVACFGFDMYTCH